MKTIPPDLAAKLGDAADEFLALGDDARIDQLAEQIGVARATLYYYFSGKDDVVSFLMQEKLAKIGAAVADCVAAGGPPLDRLSNSLSAVVENLSAQPAICLHLTAAQGRPEALAVVASAMTLHVIAPLRETLIEGRAIGELNVSDIDLTIASMMGGITRAVLHVYTSGPPGGIVEPAPITSTAKQLYVEGLRARPSAP